MSDVPCLSPNANGGLKMEVPVAAVLSNTSSSAASSATTAYATHDLNPYSAITSFNSPVATDSTLLTPTSNSGSPPSQGQLQPTQQQMHPHPPRPTPRPPQQNFGLQSTNDSAIAQRFSSRQAPLQSQPLTPPPASLGMLYSYSGGTASGQADQPSSSSASASGYELSGYMHSSTVKDEGVTSQIDPYFTPYSVPTSSGDASNSNNNMAYSVPTSSDDASNNSNNMAYPIMTNPSGYYTSRRPLSNQNYQQQPQQSLPGPAILSLGPQPLPPQQHSRVPILTHPQPSQYHVHDYRERSPMHPGMPQEGHPLGSTSVVAGVKRAYPSDDVRNTMPNVLSGASEEQSIPRSQSGVGSDIRMLCQGNGIGSNTYGSVRSNADSNEGGVLSSTNKVPLIEPEAWANATTSTPYLAFSDKASEEEKFLFHLHQKYKGNRGKGMWDTISQQYSTKYPGTSSTARLQMKFTRAFRRFVLWPESEVELLLQAYKEDEMQRFSRLTAAVRERKGGNCWEWKSVDVEMMLVRLGLEEPLLDENTKIRRRRRSAQRRRSQAQAAQQAQDPAVVMSAPAWTNGYNPTGIPHQQQYGLPAPHQHPGAVGAAYNNTGDVAVLNGTGYNIEADSEVLDQLDRKYGVDDTVS